MNLLRQCVAITNANLRSLGRRQWISISLVFSVTLVTMILLGFLAMANGFNKTLTQMGSEDVAIVMGLGARSELGSSIAPPHIHLLEEAPGLVKNPQGTTVLSAETIVPVDVLGKQDHLPATVSLRGIGAHGLTLRPSIKLVSGRLFTLGANELIVGQRLSQEYEGLTLNDTIEFGRSRWKIVGIFEANGSVFESELLSDVKVVQILFNRPNQVQSLRAQLAGPNSLEQLTSYIDANPRLPVRVLSEKQYFSAQSERVSQIILWLGWPISLVMALGAIIGALTTLYSSVSDRQVEIATVRALGFSRISAFVGTWLEGLLLTLVGCFIGLCAALLLLDGWAASTVGTDNTQIAFELKLSFSMAANAVLLALLVGAIGGGLPALHATRIPLRLAMTRRS
ncbi:ABC transporter permease [Polycladidibacter stylochi]|uniref:ABC transporter permease n=1 Tax=Polycladidibacter stylochi TaxID=1807766 RepID=UPI0008336118|nr:FtsX-like permease family protein [Pseudovibrio stylochi]